MARLDLEFVRKQFPAFSEPSLDGFAFFENAGGSYACRQVVDRLARYYRETKVQPYADYPASAQAGELMDTAKARLAAWLNVGRSELHFGPSTSMNTYVLAQALRRHLRPGDEVVVTNQDHEANIGAWRRLAEDSIVVREWAVDPDTAELNETDLAALLGDRTKVVAFTHCSNIVASVNPVRAICDLVHEAGALAIVDGVSFCPHGMPDLAALGADVYLFSLYKVYGPHLGVLYLRDAVNAALPNQGHFFNAGEPAYRFTPAGPDHAQIAAVNGVMDYMEQLYGHHFDADATVAEKAGAVRGLLREAETERLQPLLDFLSGHQRARLIGRSRADERAPTVAFTSEKRSSKEIAARLTKFGIGVGSGDFYAYRLVESLGFDMADGVVRASFVHYTAPEEIDRLLAALDSVL